jgi:hypothetical protein
MHSWPHQNSHFYIIMKSLGGQYNTTFQWEIKINLKKMVNIHHIFDNTVHHLPLHSHDDHCKPNCNVIDINHRSRIHHLGNHVDFVQDSFGWILRIEWILNRVTDVYNLLIITSLPRSSVKVSHRDGALVQMLEYSDLISILYFRHGSNGTHFTGQ